MLASLNLGDTATFKLAEAFLIYQRDSLYSSNRGGPTTAVSIHPIVLRKLKKRLIPTIGPGEAITVGGLQTLAAAIGKNVAASYLPANVVSLGFDHLAWYCPAARRRIWFQADGRFNGGAVDPTAVTKSAIRRVQALNGKFVQHPPLLFLATGGSLQVLALAENVRPQPTTRLYRAPYWNLWKTGVVCQGNRHLSSATTPAAIPELEDAFFNSAFSHTNITNLCRFPGGHTNLWEDLQRRQTTPRPEYWARHLVRLKSTVQTILTKPAEEE